LEDEELKLLLARAFDRAWSRYYRPGRVTIPAELARTALANHLVHVAKNGVTDEDQLVARSLMHLISLALYDPKSS
jgi:hypothetical protein